MSAEDQKIALALERLAPPERALIEAAADRLSLEVYLRSHGVGRLGRVGALEVLHKLGKFMTVGRITL